MVKKRVLLVMSEDMQREFGEFFSLEDVEWVGVTTCNAARGGLADNEKISKVVTNATLPDGNWYCLLQEIVSRETDLDLVVVLPAGSDPTSVQSCGADVVEYPLDAAARRHLAGSEREVVSRAAVA